MHDNKTSKTSRNSSSASRSGAKDPQADRRVAGIFLTILAAFALIGTSIFVSSGTRAQDRIEIGLLDCIVSGGSGFIFGSTKDLRCEFRRTDGAVEPYFGAIKKFGLDIGSTDSSVIRWAVLAPKTDFGPGALSGEYLGVTAEATVGVGLGANALLGGFGKSIALQPFSVQSQSGLNFAVGVAELELRSAQ